MGEGVACVPLSIILRTILLEFYEVCNYCNT
jgi:hypothetical protein